MVMLALLFAAQWGLLLLLLPAAVLFDVCSFLVRSRLIWSIGAFVLGGALVRYWSIEGDAHSAVGFRKPVIAKLIETWCGPEVLNLILFALRTARRWTSRGV